MGDFDWGTAIGNWANGLVNIGERYVNVQAGSPAPVTPTTIAGLPTNTLFLIAGGLILWKLLK